jgi:hypothetical protein
MITISLLDLVIGVILLVILMAVFIDAIHLVKKYIKTKRQ